MAHCSGTQGPVRCYCRREAVAVTCWKDGNVGRRFFGCEKYPNAGYCKFFRWIDDPMCERAREIVPGLLKKMNNMRDEIKSAQNIIEKLEEMVSIMERANNRLEDELKALKDENAKLLYENNIMKVEKGNAQNITKLWLKVLVFCCLCLGLIKISFSLCGEGAAQNFE